MTSAPRSAKKVATWPGPSKLDSITRILLRSPSAPLVGLVTTSSGHISDGPSETSRGIPGSTFGSPDWCGNLYPSEGHRSWRFTTRFLT